jgi:organic radical activating enzyme
MMFGKDPSELPPEFHFFREQQKLSSRTLGLSVTQACPLRCSHCSVSAAPELGKTTFSPQFAQSVVEQMPELRAIGIVHVSFTGGEPTLAPKFVIPVAQAARREGLRTSIVSAAHWASSEDNARRFIEKFEAVQDWEISTDVYHLPFVPLDNIRRAYRLLLEYGKRPFLRVAYHKEMTREDAEVIETCHEFAGQDISFQPISKTGRGSNLVEIRRKSRATQDTTPCPTTGPLIQRDGRVSPCCAPLSQEAAQHPLDIGNAYREPIAKLVMRWRTHPLLQAIRLWGFGVLFDWMQDAGLATEELCRDETCMTCVELAKNVELCRTALALTSRLDKRWVIARTLNEEFAEPWMEQQLHQAAERYSARRGVTEVSP